MSRRINLWTVVLAILVVPSLAFSASLHQFTVAQATTNAENLVTVPLNITNQEGLAGIDIALQFSEGVTLNSVQFEGTRVEYFDLKVANIDNESRTVVIGLLPQLTSQHKQDLAAGEGNIANLVFEIDDPSVSEVTVEAITLEDPHHSLAFVYHNADNTIRVEQPEFESVTVALASTSPAVPQEFYVAQNYPNPFNPSTTFEFALPVAGHVDLTVFNVLGQKVESVINENLNAGIHQVVWDASNVSSGVYFYRLTTGDNTETRKMMLLK
ncbi:MAG: T9SS type A sorting domain-containing protein [bacterium]